MDIVSTTNPIPPTGQTNTIAPLSITSSISQTPAPVNVPYSVKNVYTEPCGIYAGLYSVSDSYAVGTYFASWDYETPFKGLYFYTQQLSQDCYDGFMPWNLILPYFSKMCKMEYTLNLTPVKIADCRVRFDIVFIFSRRHLGKYNTNILANNNIHILLDDPSSTQNIVIPTFWYTNNVATNMMKVSFGQNSIKDYHSPYLPATKMEIYVASKYEHNTMQMPSFKIIREIFAKPSNMLCISGKRMTRFQTVSAGVPVVRDSYLTPYFLA